MSQSTAVILLTPEEWDYFDPYQLEVLLKEYQQLGYEAVEIRVAGMHVLELSVEWGDMAIQLFMHNMELKAEAAELEAWQIAENAMCRSAGLPPR
ncbi:MAG TPA: hypothetical protein V6D29_25120 [Leptolyngbyaceae cyanobacterium]